MKYNLAVLLIDPDNVYFTARSSLFILKYQKAFI